MNLIKLFPLAIILILLQGCQSHREKLPPDPAHFLKSQRSHNTSPNGFTSLFDGQKIAKHHWQGLLQGQYQYPQNRLDLSPEKRQTLQKEADQIVLQHWSVKDKSLFFDGARGRAYNLSTAKDYGNFEFYISYKLEKNGDSGIYLRGLPQIQIWDPSNPKAQIYGAQKGSGGLWNNVRHDQDLDGRWPLTKADKPIGTWNHFFIRMLGNRVTVYLNGQLTVDNAPLNNLWLASDKIPAKGPIELQCHGDPVYFKNIYIRELR